MFDTIGLLIAEAGGLAAFQGSGGSGGSSGSGSNNNMNKWLKPLAAELCSKLSDSRAEVRAAVRVALYHLCYAGDADVDVGCLQPLVPSTQFERARSALAQFIKHGAAGVVLGKGLNEGKGKHGSPSTGARSPSATASPSTGGGHRRSSSRKQHFSGASASECKAALEMLKSARKKLDQKGWKARADTLKEMCAAAVRVVLLLSPSPLPTPTVSLFVCALYDCFRCLCVVSFRHGPLRVSTRITLATPRWRIRMCSLCTTASQLVWRTGTAK